MEYQNTAFGQRTGLPKPAGFSKTPPKGARVNDLSGQVPSNQIWAQAYNQASKQQGGSSQAQSWTMPGSYSSQSFNPSTGIYSKPTAGESWSGNWAYSPMDSRPGPVTAQATGVGGNQMNWQDSLRQRDAFVGNLVNRLNQYSSGQRTGRPTFDMQQLLSQADKQIAEGTWQNPFAAPATQPPAAMPPMSSFPPEVQQAVQSAAPFVNTQWQNPFGNSPEANTPRPAWPPMGQAQPIAPPDAGTRYSLLGDVVERPVFPKESAEQRAAREAVDAAGFNAGWRREIHGPGWMSASGRYWDGSGRAPWM